MRGFASCFSEHAIKVSDSTCSGSSSRNHSVQNVVNCLYKTRVSGGKQILLTVTWCKNLMGTGLYVDVGETFEGNPRILSKKKGSRRFESGDCKIEIVWDITSAKYGIGAEPIGGFYLIVIADSELVLLLGDINEGIVMKKFNSRYPCSSFALISRKEHVFGNSSYSTRAQFCDSGLTHEILIKCEEKKGDLREPELLVIIDRKKVIHVKRLKWKFRGNQTIFVDGLPVDMLWDVHGWFFNPSSGSAVFMFRTRSGLDSRLWLEEKMVPEDQENLGFSLLIYAYQGNNPSDSLIYEIGISKLQNREKKLDCVVRCGFICLFVLSNRREELVVSEMPSMDASGSGNPEILLPKGLNSSDESEYGYMNVFQ